MTPIASNQFASEGGHWYARDGSMVETVPGANGQPVKPDIRHARKLGLLPGVTSVNKVLAAPALTNWLVDQALMAALTLPRVDGESLDDFKARAKRDSQAQSTKARDDGSDLHTALEMAAQKRAFDQRWSRHVAAVRAELAKHGVDFDNGDAERSFAHPLGYGGKNDWYSLPQNVLLDYKSKPRIEDKKLAYDDHVQQLAACAQGLMPDRAPRLLNVFVGIEDAKVAVVEWDAADASRGWQMFQHALAVWQLRNRYNSAFSPVRAAA